MRRLSVIGILTFLSFFVYFYKTSGKFRKSIVAALIAAGLLFSEPLKSEAKDVNAFTPQQQTTHIVRNMDFSSRAVKKPSKNNNGPGKPSSDGGDSDDGDFIPEYPKVESVEETENRIDRIDEYIARMDESSDSEEESESNQCPVNKTQAASFVKNGVVDLHEAYQEVLRRAAKLGAENFDCSFQRFKELSTEYREPTEVGVREAITGLQGEMLGYYKNLVRGHYGKGVSGPDFKVKGIGKYRHITHIEIKNPVGKAIEEASRGFSNLHKQGENAALKIQNQQKKWSNTTFIENQPHWNASESFPKTPANMLGIVDLFDVPFGEKPIIENSIKNNVQIGSPVIIINNQETGNV